MKSVILLMTILISSQASASSLDDALKAALGAAEKDHSSVQTSLEVNPDQIIKTKFKRPIETATINLNKMGVDDGILAEDQVIVEVERKIASQPKVKVVKQLGDI